MSYILVTNDDGVQAPGILALATAMQQLGEVRVSAPSVNQSASGHKKTLFQDIPVEKTQLANGIPALSVTGSPADCIAVAALGLIEWPPAIVVSGINRGENLSHDLTYSGTVTAALEASIHGVPAVAVSMGNPDANSVEDYATAAEIALTVVRRTLEKKLPPFTILNLNIPDSKPVKGIRITRQGVRIYRDELDQGEGYVQIVGERPTGNVEEEGSDLWAVNQGYASLTPIHLDLTAHHLVADLVAWDIKLPPSTVADGQ